MGRRREENNPEEEAQDGRILILWFYAFQNDRKIKVKYFSLFVLTWKNTSDIFITSKRVINISLFSTREA